MTVRVVTSDQSLAKSVIIYAYHVPFKVYHVCNIFIYDRLKIVLENVMKDGMKAGGSASIVAYTLVAINTTYVCFR